MDDSLDASGGELATAPRQGTSGFVRHLFSFRGKSGRLEFWVVGASWIAVFIVSYVLYLVELQVGIPEATLTTIWAVFAIPIYVWLNLNVSLRRLHDIGHPGWAVLILLIPIVNVFFYIYLLVARRGSEPHIEDGVVPDDPLIT